MKQALQAAIKIKDRVIIEIDERIIKQGGIRDSQLFAQELTPEGNVLLRRLEEHA